MSHKIVAFIAYLFSASRIILAIVNGRPAVVEKYPYLLSVFQNGSFRCGATLLSRKCVLTAAHCTTKNASMYQVFRGVGSSRQGGAMRKVRRVHKHPLKSLDIAILELRKQLNNSRVQPVKLNIKRKVKVDDPITIMGWGFTNTSADSSERHLQKAKVIVFNESSCREFFPYMKNSTFCTFGDGNSSVCSGDSGGPAIFKNQQVGVISKRTKTCSDGFSLFIRLNHPVVLWFVKKIMSKFC